MMRSTHVHEQANLRWRLTRPPPAVLWRSCVIHFTVAPRLGRRSRTRVSRLERAGREARPRRDHQARSRGKAVCSAYTQMRDKVRDKLSKKQYDDEVSWTTRTWSSLMAQRMSVALHMAAAWEIARELSLAGAEDEAALFGGGVADSVA